MLDNKTAIDTVDQELKWHVKNFGTSGQGEEYEQGFVDALDHIHTLLLQINEEKMRQEVETKLFRIIRVLSNRIILGEEINPFKKFEEDINPFKKDDYLCYWVDCSIDDFTDEISSEFGIDFDVAENLHNPNSTIEEVVTNIVKHLKKVKKESQDRADTKEAQLGNSESLIATDVEENNVVRFWLNTGQDLIIYPKVYIDDDGSLKVKLVKKTTEGTSQK